MAQLSKMQQKIYEYIASCIREQGYPPSVREIGEAVGLKSPSTVHFHLKHLEEAGVIEKGAGKGRAITLTETSVQEDRVPIVGNVAAGSPILAEECIEDYLQQNREFYCNALAYTGQNSLQEYMFDTICSQVAERVHEIEIPELRDLTADERQFIGEFVASAITGMILRWARRGMKDDPSRYRDCVRRLCDGTLIHAYLNQPGLPERGREN